MKITIYGKEYILDVDEAERLGALKEVNRFVNFDDIAIGETFGFNPPNLDKSVFIIYLKTSQFDAARIASNVKDGRWACLNKEIVKDCRFEGHDSGGRIFKLDIKNCRWSNTL